MANVELMAKMCVWARRVVAGLSSCPAFADV